MTNYERFIHDNGWKYKDDDMLLKDAYDRYWKSQHDILLSLQEFLAEVGERYDEVAAAAAYETLVELVNNSQLAAGKVYWYAHYCWCLQDAKSIVAYQVVPRKWEVNDCDTEIDQALAIDKVNREWGFEKNKITIIGVPYYFATDYQFIRFDCCGMSWLWKNESLYEIYD